MLRYILLSSTLLLFSLVCSILHINKYMILSRQALKFHSRNWRELWRITMTWALIIGLSISITVSSSIPSTELLMVLPPLLNKIVVLTQVGMLIFKV
ncbi:hypothetical protein BofuT4_uP074640.1 [Botrytis cinerea T4]|uniref:Uncharacterized protein n=1 Tax=Botryotinia fuckeliana (strain T4) TaxID=999810 RepID=G2XP56_BOTF4|nr:hypothetical protein BofuT4_uP074640.1 [Botrytis cinerea T4]